MRDDMRAGDLGFFYHSGKTPEIAGLVEVVREGYPDHTAQDPDANHFDPAATPENPRWYMVDVKLIKRFNPPVSRAAAPSGRSAGHGTSETGVPAVRAALRRRCLHLH